MDVIMDRFEENNQNINLNLYCQLIVRNLKIIPHNFGFPFLELINFQFFGTKIEN